MTDARTHVHTHSRYALSNNERLMQFSKHHHHHILGDRGRTDGDALRLAVAAALLATSASLAEMKSIMDRAETRTVGSNVVWLHRHTQTNVIQAI